MTIEREHKRQYFSCDTPGCDAELEFDPDNFIKDWQKARRAGWESKKIGSDWLHACPRHML